ncbi:MAG: flagellar basal-body MS-ring/collar protein FliF [Chloroflexota bacterium]
MDELFSSLKREVLNIWLGLTGSQRVIAVALAMASFTSVLLFTTWAQRPSYQVAFSKMSDADSGAVISRLTDMKVPYEVAENGSAILVPSSKVHEVRFQLASEGLPQGGALGFELFDKTNLGITDFTERLNYRRALEGELVRTISSLSAVERSRVHIAIPQQELYSSREKPTTASVVLKLRPGSRLDARQIRGIAHLVASSAEGLSPQNVTILDTSGSLLSAQSDDASLTQSLGATSTQLELQRGYEKEIERSVQAMLETALGPSKAVVRVSAVMDWDRVETQSESYQPESASSSPVRSSHEVQETYSGQGVKAPSGTPGTESNIRESVTTTGGDNASSKYDRKDITTNYELSKAVRRTTKAPGNLQKLSLAVILDGTPEDAKIASVKQAISAAVGLNAERGDTIEVVSMPFDRTFVQEQVEALQEAEKWNTYLDLAKGAALVVPLVLFLLLLLLRSRGGGRRQKSGTTTIYDDDTETLDDQIPEGAKRRRLIQGKVGELARGRPEIVARLMRSWVEEG